MISATYAAHVAYMFCFWGDVEVIRMAPGAELAAGSNRTAICVSKCLPGNADVLWLGLQLV